jgi:hypothetical protein
MGRITFLLLLLFPSIAFSQKIYSPSGKAIKLPADIVTPGDVSTYLQNSPRPYMYHVDGYADDTAVIVAFHFLTNWPIFIKCNHPERVKEYAEQFNLESYLGSDEFKEDIKKHITYRDLKASYVADKLGEPDAQTADQDGDILRESYDYAKLNCTLLITNGFVTKILSLKTDEQ